MSQHQNSRPSLVNQIIARLPLLEYAGRFTQLKATSGAKDEYEGCCPLPSHEDKTPSFGVSTTKNRFHCFGCGANGSVIDLYAHMHGVEVRDAIMQLAKEMNLLTKREISEPEKVLEETAAAYAGSLGRSKFAKDYLISRGLTEETIKRFGLGYSWGDETKKWSPKKRAAAVEAGVLTKPDQEGQRGEFDYMTRRIVFPIRDRAGRVVGFSGRMLEQQGRPEPADGRKRAKYMNTPETTLFRKSELLYGQHEAGFDIPKAGYVVVVEGFMDVIVLHQAGLTNTVAVMGASASDAAFASLWKQTKRIVFCLDGDKAGAEGTLRSLMKAAPTMHDGCEIAVVTLPDGMDPDEFVLQHGAEAFRDLCATAMPLSSCILKAEMQDVDMTHAESRAAFLASVDKRLEAFANAPRLQQQVRLEAGEMLKAAVILATLARTLKSADEQEIRSAIAALNTKLVEVSANARASSAAPAALAVEQPEIDREPQPMATPSVDQPPAAVPTAELAPRPAPARSLRRVAGFFPMPLDSAMVVETPARAPVRKSMFARPS